MAKQNGHLNGTAAQQNEPILAKPRRPRGLEAKLFTPEATKKYQEYIAQLRQWLKSLNEREHEKALRKLTRKELFYVNLETTYENYQKGGPLREILEGTCFEGTL
jgi:hypothetical protein